MYYAVLNELKLRQANLDTLRREFDPTFSLMPPHVTLVFPVSTSELSLRVMKQHVAHIARTTEGFPAHMRETQLSWDNYLYLIAQEGATNFIELHNALYGGVLAQHLRSELPYMPHITLGHLAKPTENFSLDRPQASQLDGDRYARAQKALQGMELNFTYDVAEIQLVELNAENTKLKMLATFALTG